MKYVYRTLFFIRTRPCYAYTVMRNLVPHHFTFRSSLANTDRTLYFTVHRHVHQRLNKICQNSKLYVTVRVLCHRQSDIWRHFFYRHNVVPSQILPMSHKSVLKVIWFIRTYDFTCTHHLWICLFDVFSNIVQKYDTNTMFNIWSLLLFSSSTHRHGHLFHLVFNVVIICHL